ncbi:hypothetical protein Droror1_Dr00002696 [Drosera rotundifolia]
MAAMAFLSGSAPISTTHPKTTQMLPPKLLLASHFPIKCSEWVTINSSSSSSSSASEIGFCRRDVVLFGLSSSLPFVFPWKGCKAEVDLKMAELVDVINAYTYLYPVEQPSKKFAFKWTLTLFHLFEGWNQENQKADVRLHIVSECVDLIDNIIISVTVGSPNSQFLKSPDKSTWNKRAVADSVLSDKSALGWMLKRLSAAVLLANALVMAAPFEALAETCEADNSLFNMPLLLSVALIGATVGGLLARQRKAELQRVNEQLRQINAALRRQAKIESYAPTLSYAPASARISESEMIVDPRKHKLISRLKSGKNYLRNQNPEKAFEEFKEALQLAQNLNDTTEEKKAARGLGASLQRQGKYREAIKYHSMVLSASEREGEDSGSAEAYGAIADCYTELGELEKAGKFYDQYIARLQTD